MTPSKTGGVNGITSFDAAKIAQHVTGNALLSGNQLIAADVSNNGGISSFDAAQIARFAASAPPFGITGTWKFVPVNRFYSSVNGDLVGQDYAALLMGDVSGNWTNTGARPTHAFDSTALAWLIGGGFEVSSCQSRFPLQLTLNKDRETVTDLPSLHNYCFSSLLAGL